MDLTGNRYSALFTRCLSAVSYTVGTDYANEFAFFYTRKASMPEQDRCDLTRKPKVIAESLTGSRLPDPLFPVQPCIAPDTLRQCYGIGKEEVMAMIVPGAGWQAKQWQAEKFQRIAAYLEDHGLRVLISGSSAERPLLQQVGSSLNRGIILTDSLEHSIAFLPHLKIFIGNDSGLTQMAAATGIHVLTFFCSTNPSFLKFSNNVITLCSNCVHSPDCKSQYCHTPPRQICAESAFMNIEAEQVENVLKEIL